MSADVLLEVKDLKKYFPIRKGLFSRVVGHVKAVDGVDLFINRGETLGLVQARRGLTPSHDAAAVQDQQPIAQFGFTAALSGHDDGPATPLPPLEQMLPEPGSLLGILLYPALVFATRQLFSLVYIAVRRPMRPASSTQFGLDAPKYPLAHHINFMLSPHHLHSKHAFAVRCLRHQRRKIGHADLDAKLYECVGCMQAFGGIAAKSVSAIQAQM